MFLLIGAQAFGGAPGCSRPNEPMRPPPEEALEPRPSVASAPVREGTDEPPGGRRAGAPAASFDVVCTDFAEAVAGLFGERPGRVALVPLVGEAGEAGGPGADHLGDRLAGALLDRGLAVVDRQSLVAALGEIDLAAAFDNPGPAARIAAADVLVVGRWALVGGWLNLDLKVVDVRTNELVMVRTLHAPSDGRLRRLAFAGRGGTAERGGSVDVEERDGRVRLTAAYEEAGASQLRLLDRARQELRAGLAGYARDALGCDLDADGVERLYRGGREVDCQFRRDGITLTMEFGVSPCTDDWR